MKLAVYALVLVAAISVTTMDATADTRCRTDYFGNTTCRDDDGNTWRGRADSFGNEIWRDDTGNTIRGRSDSFGNKTIETISETRCAEKGILSAMKLGEIIRETLSGGEQTHLATQYTGIIAAIL